MGWLLIGAGFAVFAAVGYLVMATDVDPGGWRLLALPLVLVGRGVKDGFGRLGAQPGTVVVATVLEQLPGSDRWRVHLVDGTTREVTTPLGWRWRGGTRLEPGVRVVIRSWEDPPVARLLTRTPAT